MSTAPQLPEQRSNSTRIAMERHSQRLVTAFIASGMLFMLLPGTFSRRVEPDWHLPATHAQQSVSAWLQAHGQHILSTFCGMRVLWSTRLMFWSLLLLHVGCTLRVTLEPLAYESYWNFAWKLLPCSVFVELTAAVLFAMNIFGTLLHPPAHLRAEIHSLSSTRGAA